MTCTTLSSRAPSMARESVPFREATSIAAPRKAPQPGPLSEV